MIKIITTAALLMSGMILQGQTGDIKINVSDLRNNNGKCIIYIFNSKEGFPTKPEKAIKTISGKIIQNRCVANVADLKPGEYAVAVVHDENSNDKIDTNFLGIPREGMGSSNNPRSFGPPSFNDARFNYTGEGKSLEITIKYI